MKCDYCGHEFNAGETVKVVETNYRVCESGKHHLCDKCFIDWMRDTLGITKEHHIEAEGN